jgi:hypothetical protein
MIIRKKKKKKQTCAARTLLESDLSIKTVENPTVFSSIINLKNQMKSMKSDINLKTSKSHLIFEQFC